MSKYRDDLENVLDEIQNGTRYGQYTAGISMAAGALLIADILEELISKLGERSYGG